MTRLKQSVVGFELPLFLCMLIGTATFGIAWMKSDSASRPPLVTGYDWNEQPPTLFLSVPANDCGCGLPLSDWVRAGMQHNLTVLVIAPPTSSDATAIKLHYPQVKVVSIKDFVGSSERTGDANQRQLRAMLVKNGKIVREASGAVALDEFFS